METHNDDLRNVKEDNRVEITTTTGETFEADCISRDTQNADPRTGEVRETKIWEFQTHGASGAVTIFASITDGLRSSPQDPEFPQHNSLWNETAEENIGYVDEVKIFGNIDE